MKIYRDDEGRKYAYELERLNGEITSLKVNEELLVKNIDELKDNLSDVSTDRDVMREQNEQYQNEIENIQKLLYEETEVGSKATAKVVLVTRQLDEEQKRATDTHHQLEDCKIQLKSSLITNETLKSELGQARILIQDHFVKVISDYFSKKTCPLSFQRKMTWNKPSIEPTNRWRNEATVWMTDSVNSKHWIISCRAFKLTTRDRRMSCRLRMTTSCN